MKISVITVCLNSARTIGHTLESYFAQDHAEKELIVIDGASRDETLKVINSFPREGVIVVSEPDDGLYHAANKGLALYGGDAVGLLNADDCFADTQALSRIAAALKDAEIAFGNLDFVRDHASKQVVRRWRGSAYVAGSFRQGWMPAHPTFYMRREAATRVGPFDTRYRISADYDFMLRAVEVQRFRTAFIDHVLVHMAADGLSNQSLARRLRHNYEALQSRRRWLGAPIVDVALVTKPLRKLSQFQLPFVTSPVDHAARRPVVPTISTGPGGRKGPEG